MNRAMTQADVAFASEAGIAAAWEWRARESLRSGELDDAERYFRHALHFARMTGYWRAFVDAQAFERQA